MPSRYRTLAVALCATGALMTVAVAPAAAHGGPSGSGHGVVVAHTDADTFVVANHGGQLRAVDSATLPAVGSIVKVKARKGVAKRIRVVGTATSARIKGSVTASAADRFSVTGKPDGDAVVEILFAAPIAQPAIGQRVKVSVTFEGNTLKAAAVKRQGRGGSELEGTVTAYDGAARKLTVTPEGSSPIVVAVPVSIDDTVFVVGTKIELKVLLLADGTYVLQRVDDRNDDGDDERGRGSDDRGSDDRGSDDRGSDDRGDDDDDRKGRDRGHDDH